MSKKRKFGSFNQNFQRNIGRRVRPPRDISRFGRNGRTSFNRRYIEKSGFTKDPHRDEFEDSPATFGRSFSEYFEETERKLMVDVVDPEQERSFDTEDADCHDDSVLRKFQDELDILYDFTECYLDDEVQRSFGKQKMLIAEFIIPVSKVLWFYYDPQYEPIVEEMNAVLKICSTEIFAKSLKSVLVERITNSEDPEGYFDNWDEDYQYLGYLVSLVLGTRRTAMSEETESIYIDEIGQGIWDTEINDLKNETHITPELAVDLLLKTPIMYSKMENYHIGLFYHGFLDSMIEHADDNCEYLIKDVQLKIFNYLYGRGKTSAKVVGRFLVDLPRENFRTQAESAIYGAFVDMLYDKLNSYDIDRIEFVLKYIANVKKKVKDQQPILFDFDKAADYANINRALQSLMGKNKDIEF